MDEQFLRDSTTATTDGVYEKLTPAEEPGQPTFAPWCTAEFLNTQKIINDTLFFMFAPTQYLTYYWTIVKRNIDWFNGFVPGLHDNGILSSKIATRICKGAAKLTVSGGISFEGDPNAETFLSEFHKSNKTIEKLKGILPSTNAIGFSLAKVDIDANGKLSLSFVPGNRYFAQTDKDGKVTAFYASVNFVTANTERSVDAQKSAGYSLVEERFYRNGKPCVRYRVYYAPEIATSPTYSGISGSRGVPEKELPLTARRLIKTYCAGRKIDVTYELPFDNIGAVIMKNSLSATGMEDYKCFSDSTLADCHTQLYEFDLTKTQKEEHKYLNQDFLIMPDNMIFEPVGDHALATKLERQNGYTYLNKRIAKAATYQDPTKAAPFVYSPPLKIQAYNEELNQLLNEIAAQTGFSPVTLAGFLKNGVEKTATEITADENDTRGTIKTKRGLIVDALNTLGKVILKHYGYTDLSGCPLECTAVFREGGLSNPSLEIDLIVKKLKANLITHQQAVEEANPQLSKREAEEVYKLAKEEKEANAAAPFGDIDSFESAYR